MLKIRLSRTGRKNSPSYRIVVAEHSAPIKGKFIEILGHYIPIRNPKVFEYDEPKIREWIAKGAKPTDTVASLLKNAGVTGMEAYIEPKNKNKKKKKEVEEEASAPAAPAAPATEGGDAPAEEPAKDAPKDEEKKEDEKPAEEAPKEEAPAPAEEPAAEEKPEEKPAEEPKEEKAETPKEEA